MSLKYVWVKKSRWSCLVCGFVDSQDRCDPINEHERTSMGMSLWPQMIALLSHMMYMLPKLIYMTLPIKVVKFASCFILCYFSCRFHREISRRFNKKAFIVGPVLYYYYNIFALIWKLKMLNLWEGLIFMLKRRNSVEWIGDQSQIHTNTQMGTFGQPVCTSYGLSLV